MRLLLPFLPLVLLLPALAATDALTRTDPVAEHIRQFEADRSALRRLYPFPLSAARHDRMERFYTSWKDALHDVEFVSLDRDGQLDWILFHNLLEHELRAVAHERARDAEVAPLIPFAPELVALLEARARREIAEPRAAAEVLAAAKTALEEAKKALKTEKPDVRAVVANRASERASGLRRSLQNWYRFGSGYDPLFSWWCESPWAELESGLRDYARFLRKDVGGLDPDDADQIVGDPIGREALLDELAFEMLPYTPEELLEIAEREFDWCQARRLEASRDLGFGEDWRRAQEHVKSLHVGPGEQPDLILMLAEEAVEFLEERDLVTIPELCKEVWRMEMMSPERQKLTPYFTGGEVISISFPTPGMAHEDKLMSMRGNNVHYSRATVHHELIPGHHLQGYMARRWNTHRRSFGTPFYGEGWALYWEFRLWDLGFPQSAEDRIGMLFWRTHRAARILFSLNFQLGNWTPEECIDFLVENVGHERRNAEAEVRRSVQGGYGPLYQAAYMLGGLQLHALQRELVESGRMSERAFHDAVLQQNSVPVEIIRAALTDQPLNRGFRSSWRFYDG